ncbi:MAG: hypothetical protein E7014_00480 [Alphaproteobacteria bacterium]|nr:hypothetical protein [Alphaproteobacteria bacterium]
MQIKMNEIGRSMVEMLGVLAVIGVLSVAGILGYKFAINKYIANETMYELNIRATDISQRMEKLISINHAGEIDMEMGPVMRMGYPITARMSPQYTDYFEIFISDVPSDICKLLLQSQWQAPYSIFIGITEYEASIDICSQAEKVELAYEFYKDIQINPEEIDEDEKHKTARCIYDSNCKCGRCKDNICVSDCFSDEECVKDYGDLSKMICCNKNLIRNGYCCASITEDGKCCDEKGQCCPDDKPIMMKDGSCQSCTTTTVLSVADMKTDCLSMCPSRIVYKGRYENRCILPCGIDGTPTAGKPIPDSWGNCKACSDTTEFIYMSDKYTSTEYSQWCDNACFVDPYQRVTNGSACAFLCPEGQMRDENGKCVDCDSPTTIPLSYNGGKCKEICGDRKVGGTDNKYCILDECPEKTIRMKNGSCMSCDTTDNPYVGDLDEDCETACPNRIYYKGRYEDRCTLPCGVAGTPTEGKPIPDSWGACKTCDNTTEFLAMSDKYTSTEYKKWCDDACTIAPYKRVTNGSSCALLCPTGQMRDANGKCVDCNSPSTIPLSYNGGKCKEICGDRKVGGTDNKYCILDECPAETIRMKSGACTSCTSTSNIAVADLAEDCETACPNRIYYKGCYEDRCNLPCGVDGTSTEGKPLTDCWGTCYPCDKTGALAITTRIADTKGRCETMCPNRDLIGTNQCTFRECPAGFFADTFDKCYPCDSALDVESDTDRCTCLNRTLKDGKCILLY